MARDQCVDCEHHFPGGEGLKAGRCPTCLKAFQARHKAARSKAPTEEAEEEEE